MKLFTRLFIELDQTNKTNTKLKALVKYLDQATDKDKLWMIALLSGKRPKRSVKTSQLKQWAAEIANIPYWLFEESYHVVGDLSETIALIFPATRKASHSSLSYWMDFIIGLQTEDDECKKEKLVNAWLQMDSAQRFVFNKLSSGGFRIGVSQKLMVRALAQHTGVDQNSLAHRLMGNWSPESTSFQDLIHSKDPLEDISKPYPFYLAHPLADQPRTLGEPHQWLAERKWDGIRGQLIVRGGNLFVWSRGEELVTEKFPEFLELKDQLPLGTVLDGEILPFSNGKPLSFNVLQTRIGRKNITKKILDTAPVILKAYDLLEYNSEDIRHQPLAIRRELLTQIVDQTACTRLKLSEVVPFENWKSLEAERNLSRSYNSEGIMLKRMDSVYGVGRKRGDWFKWKVDPLTVDGVMVYAMRGHGRRANLYTDYTFAVWKDHELVPFTKAYSGLTDQEIRAVDRFVKRNTLERFGPVRSASQRWYLRLPLKASTDPIGINQEWP